MLVIGNQVVCARSHVTWNGSEYVKSGKAHTSWLDITKNIKQNHGLKGFYRGYFPALLLYAAFFYYEFLVQDVIYTTNQRQSQLKRILGKELGKEEGQTNKGEDGSKKR